MRKNEQGLTLIELMSVVALIGILAAIAIPAYQDYTIRAKVSEPMTFADAAKVSVSEYYQTMGRMPTSITEAGIQTTSSQYIASVGYGLNGSDARITITTRELGNNVTGDIILDGTGTADGTVNWVCTESTLANKYL